MLNDRTTPSCVLLLHQVDSPMVANCFLEAWPIATSMFWFPNLQVTLVTLQTLNKTSTNKLSSISCLIWSPHGNIPKYHDQNLPGPDLQGLPTYSLGSQGCAAWLPATTAMKVNTREKKQRGKQRSSKMFQDVSTDTKRCLNYFRSSFSDEFQTKSPARFLLWPHQEMENPWETKIDVTAAVL